MPRKGIRTTQTPTLLELDVRGIPELMLSCGWRMFSLEEVPLIGTVAKNYIAQGTDPYGDHTVGFIAKKAKRSGDLECVTEEVISAIGHLLPIRIADSRLVRLAGTTPPDVRFMSKMFLRRSQESLVHGAELVASYLGTTQEEVSEVFRLTDRLEERRFYTVDFVADVLVSLGRDQAERRHLLDSFGRMLAFDALIGAPDRHALNWGVIQATGSSATPLRFAPIFDTARGLFCEHREAKLVAADLKNEREEVIAKYAERSMPVFGCGCVGGDQVNHFRLFQYALEHLPPEASDAMRAVVGAFDIVRTERMLRRRFTRIITQRRIGWILDLLRARSARLKLLASSHP